MSGLTVAVKPLHLETPLLRSRKLSEKAGASVWLKLENVQNSGSFKVRGLGLLAQKVSVCYSLYPTAFQKANISNKKVKLIM